MEKINVAELLRNCPSGMELDCTMYEDVCFYKITDDPVFPVRIKRIDGAAITLTKYGGYADSPSAKCVIFPKGKTTWEGFVPPCKFKIGDRIKHKESGLYCNIGEYVESFKGYNTNIGLVIRYDDIDNWELYPLPNKFDITTLKPFDKVLVRDFDNTPWEIEFFSRLLDGKQFKCFELSYVQCIPYKGNEHLLGKKDGCNKYFKTWE